MVIAVGTGIIVTRSASDSKLTSEVLRQVTSVPKAIGLVICVLAGLLMLPGIPAWPLLALMGTKIWFVADEPETVAQSAPSAEPIELVCICNRQPVWSVGQLKLIWPPLVPRVSSGAVVATGRALTAAELTLSPKAFVAETTK